MNILNNKVSIINAGSSEISRVCALSLLKNGAKVILTDKDEEGLKKSINFINEKGYQSLYFLLDHSKEENFEELIKFAQSEYDIPSILINNASTKQEHPFLEMDNTQWQNILNNNLSSTINYFKKLIPCLIEAGGGSIVNLLSILGLRGASKNCAFSTTQGAILSLSKSIAIEYAHYDIRVNSILMGSIKTDLYRENRLKKEPEFEKKLIRHIPLKRLGEPKEVANLALFLVSKESSYITGTSIPLDGGYMII